MNIATEQLRGQFDRVMGSDWWPHLIEACDLHFPLGAFDAVDLFAIGSRETNWNPRYLREPGDNGNGFGPMQIDRRSFPDWIATGAWKIPREAILKGAEVLWAKLQDARAMQGRKITVRTGSGQAFSVTGKNLAPEEQKRVAIAAYNCGIWAHYHVSKGRDPDHGTTGKDYSADVLERAEVARPWVPASAPATTACPACGGSGRVAVASAPEPGWSRIWGGS